MSKQSRRRRIAKMIRAASDEKMIQFSADSLEWIKATDGDATKPKRFSMLAYTGGAMRVGHYGSPVVIDLAGLTAAAPLPILLECYERYGPVFSTRIMHGVNVWALGPEANHQILVSDARNFLKHWTGVSVPPTPLPGAGRRATRSAGAWPRRRRAGDLRASGRAGGRAARRSSPQAGARGCRSGRRKGLHRRSCRWRSGSSGWRRRGRPRGRR